MNLRIISRLLKPLKKPLKTKRIMQKPTKVCLYGKVKILEIIIERARRFAEASDGSLQLIPMSGEDKPLIANEETPCIKKMTFEELREQMIKILNGEIL